MADDRWTKLRKTIEDFKDKFQDKYGVRPEIRIDWDQLMEKML